MANKIAHAWKMFSFAMQHNALSLTEFVNALQSIARIGRANSPMRLLPPTMPSSDDIHKSKGLESVP